MALYQPTNIIPSSYTKGTVDVNENMEISWQVNGNSAMTAFQIDFYLNDTLSTYVTTTGKKGATPEEQVQLGLPFYGTDRFGRPEFFTWNVGETWANWSLNKFTNGNEYKYKITQWYKGENSVVRSQALVALSVGNTYYFKVPDSTAIVYFSVSSNLTAGTNNIYYSYANNYIWVDSGSRIVLCGGGYVESGSIPSGAIEVTGEVNATTLDELFVSQTSSNIVVTRDKPTLTIYRSNEYYVDEIDFPNGGSIATSIGFFKAVYEQKQGDSIRWVRWQVATANNGQVGEIIADTGDIYTPTLNYEYNGFFNGQQYAIRAIGESESGQETNLQGADKNGWIFFTINIENQGKFENPNFTVQCLNRENATLLEWNGVEVIPPITSPQGYEPKISNGAVTINGKDGDTEYSVTWDKVMDKNGNLQDMNFEPYWTAVWKGNRKPSSIRISEFYEKQSFQGSVADLMTFNYDGTILIQYNKENNYLQVFNFEDGDVTLKGYLTSTGSVESGRTKFGQYLVSGIAFSPVENVFAVSTNKLYIYYLNDGQFLLKHILEPENKDEFGLLAFNPNGKLLLCGLVEYGETFSQGGFVVYSLYPNDPQKIYSWKERGSLPLVLDFNLMGNLIIFAGNDIVKLFSVKENEFLFLSNILNDTGGNFEGIIGGTFNKGSYPEQLVLYDSDTRSLYNYFIKDGSARFLQRLDVAFYPITSRPYKAIAFSIDGNSLVLSTDNGAGERNLLWYNIENNGNLVFNKNLLPNNGTWGSIYSMCFNPIKSIMIVSSGEFSYNQIYSFDFIGEKSIPYGKILELKNSNNDLITVSTNNNYILIKFGQYILENFYCPVSTSSFSIIITNSMLSVFFYMQEKLIEKNSTRLDLDDWQQAMTSLSIYGGDSGATVDSVSVYQGDGSNIISLYENPNFEPVWNHEQYKLYMTANFNGNLEGGTGTATGSGFRVYRQEIGKNVLTPIATVPSTTTSVKDYGIVSRKAYKYSLYAYDNNGAFMSAVENEKIVATCFKNYSLLVCDYDETNDEYHVRKQYLFALNLSVGSVGNNNSPTLNANFTRYPTRMPSTQNYASGTLQGLIGAIYTVPALIEQIGNYKYTAKPSTLDYFDNVDLEKELYDLSTAPYQLFLRDMKGRLRMIATNSAITMTTNIKQKQQSISISFPWVEIGDASDVTIIQTPEDYGWNNDNQMLDVSLDVDVATGELSATYPFPYNGTKFYLTGVNQETIMAKTPLGITPAQFELSDIATEPNDGELNATVKLNSEDN